MISDEVLAALAIKRAKFHGDWNHALLPVKSKEPSVQSDAPPTSTNHRDGTLDAPWIQIVGATIWPKRGRGAGSV